MKMRCRCRCTVQMQLPTVPIMRQSLPVLQSGSRTSLFHSSTAAHEHTVSQKHMLGGPRGAMEHRSDSRSQPTVKLNVLYGRLSR